MRQFWVRLYIVYDYVCVLYFVGIAPSLAASNLNHSRVLAPTPTCSALLAFCVNLYLFQWGCVVYLNAILWLHMISHPYPPGKNRGSTGRSLSLISASFVHHIKPGLSIRLVSNYGLRATANDGVQHFDRIRGYNINISDESRVLRAMHLPARHQIEHFDAVLFYDSTAVLRVDEAHSVLALTL